MSVFSKFYNISSPTFPLRKLPILAQDEILKTMSPVELLNLSRTSYKLKSVIKNHKAWKQFRKIILTIDREGFSFGFSVANGGIDKILVKPRKSKHVFHKNISEGDSTIKVKYGNRVMKTYWTDVSLGIQSIGDYILNMFHLHLLPTLHFHLHAWPVGLVEDVIDWIHSKSSMEVNSCTVYRYPKKKEMHHIQRDLKHAKSYASFLRFSYWRTCQPMNLMNLNRVYRNEEFAMLHLALIDPETLFLNHSKLTSGDLNRFLKAWKEGGPSFHRIKFFRVQSSNVFRKEKILEGLKHVKKPDTVRRSYFETKPHEIVGGYDIVRINGVTATIHLEDSVFQMVVWPDFEGNMA